MIEVKRRCSSNVRDYDGQCKVQFNDFSISITEDEYEAFSKVLNYFAENGQVPSQTYIDVLQEIIEAGIYYYYDRLEIA